MILEIIKKIINLIRILRIYYGHTFLAIIKTLFRISKQCHQQWARLTYLYLKVKLRELKGSKKLKDGKLMIFANHRSQADFFLHNVITNYQANFLARMAVLVASPAFIVSYKTVWFFNRGKKTDPQKFNQWLDYKFAQSPRPILLSYPEGHRVHTIHPPQTLRTGMLKYSYRRKISSQILISFGNETVLNEKKLNLNFNQTVVYKISDVINVQDFDTEQLYVKEVQKKFKQIFQETYRQYVRIKQGLEEQEEKEEEAHSQLATIGTNRFKQIQEER